ncbi:hypothetical protein ACFSQD_16615 [Flavihumibacter stibioxidans]|uniref:Tetratricopeptide repeat protein n=1 Tax=Flavihumibacter stibioxidans TaxID=1834163 RepID=A0ABR7M6Y3_9BACT|nr:hypothetical protein [Flavihumibacter stibioxidans]MBC6490768.1 hypothetical protein [Flavihumibacter stibioxidans]
MKLTVICSVVMVFILAACGSSGNISKRYTYEDKEVFNLIARLEKNPSDREASRLLPESYNAAIQKRKEITNQLNQSAGTGDKYMEMAGEWEVLLQMYKRIRASPAASKALPDPWDPSRAIDNARKLAADEYYDAGMVYMGYNTRQQAQQAYDYFEKASRAYPGYKDVDRLLQAAAARATIRVLVNPVNYNRFGWSYWGFRNDWLQQEMVRDLNARSYKNVRFYTDWELRSQQLVPDRIVDLDFTELFVDQVHSDSRTYRRSKEIETGRTKSVPPKPIYQTVYATVYVNRRYMSSYATLECRIYDRETNRNMLYDRFPDRFDWKQETARYTGDRRALTPGDLALINNRYDDYPPGREQIVERLVRNTYNQLLNRIQSGVSF